MARRLNSMFKEANRRDTVFMNRTYSLNNNLYDMVDKTNKSYNKGNTITDSIGVPRRALSRYNAANLKRTVLDASNGSERNMDSGTRKAMQRFYYRQSRVANGLNGG